MNPDAINATMDNGLEELDRAKATVKQCLTAYRTECRRLIREISCGSRSDADAKFDTLFQITARLSKTWFAFNIDIGADLEIIVRQFERLHEPHTRDYWFERFKAGEDWPEECTPEDNHD